MDFPGRDKGRVKVPLAGSAVRGKLYFTITVKSMRHLQISFVSAQTDKSGVGRIKKSCVLSSFVHPQSVLLMCLCHVSTVLDVIFFLN